MATANAFMPQTSALNPFLFANVGIELNGSALTILSVLARLDQDPWAEAARWARLPRAAAIDCLTESISQMPLCQEALTGARATAAELTGLLPRPGRTKAVAPEGKRWVLVGMIYGVLAVGVALNLLAVQMPAGDAPNTATLARVSSSPKQ